MPQTLNETSKTYSDETKGDGFVGSGVETAQSGAASSGQLGQAHGSMPLPDASQQVETGIGEPQEPAEEFAAGHAQPLNTGQKQALDPTDGGYQDRVMTATEQEEQRDIA